MAQTIFTNQVPSSLDANDISVSTTLGTTWYSEDDGAVTAVRFYLGNRNYDGVELTGGVFNADTEELLGQGSKTITASDNIGYVEIPLDEPVRVTRNQDYIAGVLFPSDGGGRLHYAATGGLFLTTGFDNPPLHAYQDNGTFLTERNGVYADGATLTFPNSTFNGGCYFVDVVFDYVMDVKVRDGSAWVDGWMKTRAGGTWRV